MTSTRTARFVTRYTARTAALAFVTLAVSACGGTGPASPGAVVQATASVDATVTAGGAVHVALDLLGVLPDTTCGTQLPRVAADIEAAVHAESACLGVSVDAVSATESLVTVTAAEGGACSLRGHNVEGRVTVRLRESADDQDVSADFRGLRVDGRPLGVQASYGGCGDDRRYTILAAGPLAGSTGASYRLEAHLAQHDGHSLLGARTDITFDAQGEIVQPEGTSRVVIRGLRYRVGDTLPTAGTLEIATASGLQIAASFHGETPIIGHIDLAIDAHDPVKIPIIH